MALVLTILALVSWPVHAQQPDMQPAPEPAAPPVASADALWLEMTAAHRRYRQEPARERLVAVLEAAVAYLDGEPEPGSRTQLALGLAWQAQERLARWADLLALVEHWEPEIAETDPFAAVARAYRGKAHAYLGNVDAAREALDGLEGLRVEDRRVMLYVRQAAAEIRQAIRLRPGAAPPAFTLRALRSEAEHSLADFAGRYVLIQFWASWCGHSHRLIERELQPLAEAYSAERLQLVALGVNWRDTRDEQRRRADTLGVDWLLLHDDNGAVAQAYGVRHVPFLVLVDAAGRTVVAGSGWAVLERVKEALAEALEQEPEQEQESE